MYVSNAYIEMQMARKNIYKYYQCQPVLFLSLLLHFVSVHIYYNVSY